MAHAFPKQLKHWRNIRRMSQMDLGLAANVSARHVSFLETGRAAPSRSMVLQLCQTLEVPLHGQNTLLQAAGYAEVYANRSFSDAEMKQAREAVEWTLQKHDPFPAIALDKHWTIIKANRTATMLLTAVGLKESDSLLHAMQHSKQLRNAITNWPDVAHHMVNRFRTESAKQGHDSVLDSAARALASQLNQPEHTQPTVVLSTHYKVNGLEFSLFSLLAQFGSAEDIALADFKIELMFPADEATRELLMSL